MRRRWVLAIVIATALVFLFAGTAFGHYVVPRSKSDSAQCVILRHDLTGLTYYSPGESGTDEEAKTVVDLYNEHCR